jgi:cholesterol transport system auxiliary component
MTVLPLVRALLAASAMSSLLACSGLRSSAPATQVYRLQPLMPAAMAGTATDSLAVVLPVVAPGLDSDRISLIQPDGRLDSYAASRWPDALALVLQPLIVDALRAGGRYRIVQTDAMPFNAEYLLLVEVRQFAIEYDTANRPAATVSLVCTLGRRADRTPVRSFSISNSVPASADRMGAVVEAYNQALGTALQQLVLQANP